MPNPSTGEMLGVAEGVGGLTEGASTSILVPDYQGVYKEVLAGSPARDGGRVVSNNFLNSDSVSDSFTVQGNAIISGTEVSSLSADYDGLRSIPNFNKYSTGVWRCFTLVMWAEGANIGKTVTVQPGNLGQIAIALTGTPTKYSIPHETTSGRTFIRRFPGETITAFHVSQPQYEYGEQLPGEYIETSGAALTKVFAKERTVSIGANQVVTEAVGAWIDPLPRLVYAPEKTNLEDHGRDLTSNPKYFGLTTSFGASGIDQTPSATTLTDNDAAQTGFIRIQTTVVPGAKFYTILFDIEKKTDAVYFQITQQFWGGTVASARTLTVRYSDLNTVENSAFVFNDYAVAVIGDFIRVAVVQEDVSGNNNEVRTQISPFYSIDGTNIDNTLTGSAVVDGFEVVESSYLISAEAQLKNPPVFTAGAPVTRTARALSFDIANHNNAVGGYYIELTLPVSPLPALRFEVLSTTNTYSLAYVHNYGSTFWSADQSGGVGIARPEQTANVTIRLGVIYSAGENRKMVMVDGAESEEDSFSGYTLADKLMLCRIGSVCAKVGPIRRYEGTFDEMKAQLESDIAAGEAA